MLTSCTLPSVMPINVGILPCKSSRVCSLMAALCRRKRAHGNSERHRSMVVESNAYRLASKSMPIGSPADNGRARHLASKSHVVEFAADRVETRFDVTQAFAVCELSEAHCQKLVPTGKAL